jgi:hypothetical protein
VFNIYISFKNNTHTKSDTTKSVFAITLRYYITFHYREEKSSLQTVFSLGTIEPIPLLIVIALTILGPLSLPKVVALGILEPLSLLVVIALRRQ